MKLKWIRTTGLLLAAGMAFSGVAKAQDTIKVGILHSLSGTMAISEDDAEDTILMMIDEQNKKGGLLGKKLEAVVVDPASNWPLFAEKAQELLEKDKGRGGLRLLDFRFLANPCFLCSKRTTGCSFTLCNMRERSRPKTSSIPVRRRTNRRFPQWIT